MALAWLRLKESGFQLGKMTFKWERLYKFSWSELKQKENFSRLTGLADKRVLIK